MNIDYILLEKSKILSLIEQLRLHDAFASLRPLVKSCSSWELDEEFDKNATSYRLMLQYLKDGISDPQRDEIYNGLKVSLYTLVEKTTISLLSRLSTKQYYAVHKKFSTHNETLENTYNRYLAELSKLNLYESVPENSTEIINKISLNKNVEIIESELFNYIWTVFPLSKQDEATLKDIISGKDAEEHLKSLLLSAVYLNLTFHYQKSLLIFLLDQYNESNSDEIKVRALCSALLSLIKYNDTVSSSKLITNRLSNLSENLDFCNDMRSILLQFIRSQDTDKITKIVQDNLMPGIMKISPDIINKFKGNSISNFDITDMESNPEWQELLDKSGFSKKLMELNDIQMEGGDVFMGTFSRLKSFPFFYEISNWFLPFYDTHSSVMLSFGSDNNAIKAIISNARFLCNSDKYSFCLSLATLPKSQRDMMLSQFDSQNAALQELKNSELPNLNKRHEEIANKFMQDIYRFFKLYERRNEFDNPFSNALDLRKTSSLENIILHKDTLLLMGEYYLKNSHYNNAIACFTTVLDKYPEHDERIIQKIGFCYQCLKDYDNALEYYLRYSFFKDSDTWNIRHIASCYKSLQNTEKALEYYKKAEMLLPENLSVILNIGHCLLEMGKIEDALKFYFKVDYLDKTKSKALRPIAWCSFINKNYDVCQEYYNRILKDEPTSQDYLNYGHLMLAIHNTKEAIEAYKKSIMSDNNNINNFIDNIHNDEESLINIGYGKNDIPLVIDMVLFELDKS